MATTLVQLAQLVGGDVFGATGQMIDAAAVLDDARPGCITFVDKAEKAKLLAGARASAVVVPRGMIPDGISGIAVDDVHAAFAAIVSYFRPRRPPRRIGVSPAAVISPTARIERDVDIHPGAVIGDDVRIGAGATIHPGVHVMAGCSIGVEVTIFSGAVLYDDTVVGPRSIIHAGAVIGCYGFGYSLVEGRHQLAAQLGYVEIGADVEIGACSTIDRGTYGPTVIGEGTKIDNQVMIAHNCRIGRHNMICSQVGIAGSTSTGDYVVMAGQVGVRDHVHIGHRAVLGAKAGVSNDVPDGSFHLGIPAVSEREQKLRFAAISKLPEMRHELKALQRTVEALVRRQGGLPADDIVNGDAATDAPRTESSAA